MAELELERRGVLDRRLDCCELDACELRVAFSQAVDPACDSFELDRTLSNSARSEAKGDQGSWVVATAFGRDQDRSHDGGGDHGSPKGDHGSCGEDQVLRGRLIVRCKVGLEVCLLRVVASVGQTGARGVPGARLHVLVLEPTVVG